MGLKRFYRPPTPDHPAFTFEQGLKSISLPGALGKTTRFVWSETPCPEAGSEAKAHVEHREYRQELSSGRLWSPDMARCRRGHFLIEWLRSGTGLSLHTLHVPGPIPGGRVCCGRPRGQPFRPPIARTPRRLGTGIRVCRHRPKPSFPDWQPGRSRYIFLRAGRTGGIGHGPRLRYSETA